jgi:hypothetical protein
MGGVWTYNIAVYMQLAHSCLLTCYLFFSAILSYYLLSILFLTCLFDSQDSCMRNKLNREKVRYPQYIGSQSYIAKAYILVRK